MVHWQAQLSICLVIKIHRGGDTLHHMAQQARSRESRVIADTIRAERAARGISQRELAEAIGISQQGLLRYEKGTRDITTADLMKIAAALGVSFPTFARRLQDRLDADPG